MTLAATEMSVSQMERAAVEIARADDPRYVARQLRGYFALSKGQVVAIRELANIETQRRALYGRRAS